MLIDLDVPAPPPPPRRWWRWKLLVAAVLLLLLGGAASPAGPVDLAPVTDTTVRAVSAHVLTEDALYTTHSFVGAVTEVRAWPVRRGGPNWVARVPGEEPRLLLSASTVIADAGYEGGLTMLDAGTGRERWRVEAATTTAVVGDRVAIWSVGILRVADVATGRTVWTHPAAVGALYAAGDNLVALDFDLRATIYAVATGRVLVAGRDLGIDQMLWEAQPPDEFMALAAVGDQIYVYGPRSVTAYRLGDLTRLWRTELGMPLDVSSCGSAICVPEPDDLTVLDPATGAVRWHNSRFRTLTAAGVASGWDGRTALVDPATGRIKHELGRGIVAGDLVLRPHRDHTVVTTLDGGLVGFLPVALPLRCTVSGPYLACARSARLFTIWRFRTEPRR